MFCGSLNMLSRRSCHATFSGFLRPHGMQKQHFRPTGSASLAAEDAVLVCSTLFVRRQHKNLLRHNEHFPGSLGVAALLSAMAAAVWATSGSGDELLERLQHPHSFLDFLDATSGDVDGSTLLGDFLRRQRWQHAVFRMLVHGMHIKPKHGSQQRRHLQQVGRGCAATLLAESVSPFSDL